MKASENSENQDGLRKIWETSGNIINQKYHLNKKDMENILAKESAGFYKKFRANIYFDIVFKCLMMCGLIVTWIIYPANLLVAGTTLFLTVLNSLLIAKLAGVLVAGQSGHDFTKSTAETIKASIRFYSGQSAFVPLSWGLSAGTFYILGSFLYYHFKYGAINPFHDIQDIVILCLFMVIGIALAFTSHYYATQNQFRSLSKLASDMENEEGSPAGVKKYMKEKTNRYLLGILIAVMGLILLFMLIFLLRQ